MLRFCRPFWIRWLDGKTNIYLGRGYEPGVSQFYSTGGALDFPVNALSISTSSANNGSWHFNIGKHVSLFIADRLFCSGSAANVCYSLVNAMLKQSRVSF